MVEKQKNATGYSLEEVKYLEILGVTEYEEIMKNDIKLWKAIK